jgi:hypothetical protein
MKRLFILLVFCLLIGCVAHVTPEGTYIEPLPATVVIGPPVVIEPPPHVIVRPLPPVVLYPDRYIYFYNNIYYYHYDRNWYYGEHDRGPWHRLPEKYYPPRSRSYERDRHGRRD